MENVGTRTNFDSKPLKVRAQKRRLVPISLSGGEFDSCSEEPRPIVPGLSHYDYAAVPPNRPVASSSLHDLHGTYASYFDRKPLV